MSSAAATVAALEAMKGNLDRAMENIVQDSLNAFGRLGRIYAPVGTPGNSTNAPGDLRDSIVQKDPVIGGAGRWLGRIGPTVIYARQRELGGVIKPVFARRLRFHIYGENITATSVYQHPQPYMATAYVQGHSDVRRIVGEQLTIAINGG